MRKKTLFLVLAAVATLALLFLTTRHREPDEGFEFVPDENQSFASAGESLVWYTPNELRQYDLEGDTLNSMSLNMSEPRAVTDGDRCLIWDKGARKLLLLDGSGETKSFTSPGRLIYACLGEEGAVLCTEKAGCAACVTVLDTDFSAVYKWYSAENVVFMATLSPDGETLAVVRDDAVLFISTETGETLAKNEGVGQPSGAQWFGDDALCLVTETAAYISDTSGDTDKYDYGDRALGLFAFTPDGVVLELRRHASGGDGQLLSLDASLKKCGTAETKMLISLAANDGEVLALDRDTARLYGKNLKLKDTADLNAGITGLYCGDSAVIIQNTHAGLW